MSDETSDDRDYIDDFCRQISDISRRMQDDLDRVKEENQELRLKAKKAAEFSFGDWFAYGLLTVSALFVVAGLGTGIWHFIHWAAQPDKPSTFCFAKSPNGDVECHTQ